MISTQNRDGQRARTNAALRLKVQVCDDLMRKQGIKSVAALARKAKVSKSQLFRIRSGESGMSLPLAMRLAAIARTTVENLIEPVGE